MPSTSEIVLRRVFSCSYWKVTALWLVLRQHGDCRARSWPRDFTLWDNCDAIEKTMPWVWFPALNMMHFDIRRDTNTRCCHHILMGKHLSSWQASKGGCSIHRCTFVGLYSHLESLIGSGAGVEGFATVRVTHWLFRIEQMLIQHHPHVEIKCNIHAFVICSNLSSMR